MAMLFNILAIAEIALLVMAMVSGIIVAVLAGRQSKSFNGDCPLAGSLVWVSRARAGFELEGSSARCEYVIGVQSVAAIIAFAYGLYRLIVLCCGRFDVSIFRQFCIPVYSIMAILTLAEAAVLSHGLNALCDSLISLQVSTNYESRCEYFQQVKSFWHIYDGSSFFDDYSTAEAAGWVSFLAWVSLVAVGVLHCLAERPGSGFPLPNNAQ